MNKKCGNGFAAERLPLPFLFLFLFLFRGRNPPGRFVPSLPAMHLRFLVRVSPEGERGLRGCPYRLLPDRPTAEAAPAGAAS